MNNERSLQDILEWIVLGLLIAVAALVVLWVGGWVFRFLGSVLLAISGIIWVLLKFAVPALIIAAAIYFLVRYLQRPKTA
ncbi:MAG: hypothetical protein HZB27_01990 [Meiothermus silvanus]|nr:hypothetical protein [Allomeiothermus silvanus]